MFQSLSRDQVATPPAQLDPATRIAIASHRVASLIRKHDIRLHLSKISPEGVCVADATQNPTNAYKVRGALAAAATAQEKGHSQLVTASAGNHGAGVAYAAKQLGLEAVVYVPKNAPLVKVKTIEEFGAQVHFSGGSFDECLKAACMHPSLREGKAAFVHPFDDPCVVAGQGTIGFEILGYAERHLRAGGFEKVRIFLPVGGGGLAAGVASVIRTCWPSDLREPEIFGVIDESAPAALLATMRGRRVFVMPDTIADGTKVAEVGDTFITVSPLLNGLLLVPHDEIVEAMRAYERRTTVKLEGAGALALAGEAVSRNCAVLRDTSNTLTIPVVTGRNIDPLKFDAELNADARMNATVLRRQGFDIVMHEREGELLRFLQTVKDVNIASLTYAAREGSRVAHLRVEFEMERQAEAALHRAIVDQFPGSQPRKAGEHSLHRITKTTPSDTAEQCVSLADHPGSFLGYVEGLVNKGMFGSVDFLFYRKPASRGRLAQVVIGQK